MTAFVVMLVLLQVCAMVFSFTMPKDGRVSWGLYLPSLVIGWLGYVAYEAIYIPRNCPGECNIRFDLVIIFPYLLFVTVCAIAYFARKRGGPPSR